jgi:hypothetical protein
MRGTIAKTGKGTPWLAATAPIHSVLLPIGPRPLMRIVHQRACLIPHALALSPPGRKQP